jgi:hypothetical protein
MIAHRKRQGGGNGGKLESKKVGRLGSERVRQ